MRGVRQLLSDADQQPPICLIFPRAMLAPNILWDRPPFPCYRAISPVVRKKILPALLAMY
jgi:hypothetical protein